MYDLRSVLIRSYIEHESIVETNRDVTDDFKLHKYIHYVGNLNDMRVILAAYFDRCDSKIYRGFASLRIISADEMWTIPVTSVHTDLRSGPSLIDKYIPNTEYWWIWLIHDMMGSCGSSEEVRTRHVLKGLMSHHAVPLASIIDKVTFYTRWLWTTKEISPIISKIGGQTSL